MRFRRRLTTPGAALALLLLLASGAAATPLLGDQTRVQVTGDLGALALDVGGTASVNAIGELVLPISGGDVTVPLLEGEVEHAGTRLALAAGGNQVALSDLVIDLTDELVTGFLELEIAGVPQFSGDVALFDTRVCLFATAVDPCLDSDGSLLLNGYGLDLTATLATFLNDAFGAGAAGGDAFGVALLDLRFKMPGPTVLPLLLGAAAGALLRLRRVR